MEKYELSEVNSNIKSAMSEHIQLNARVTHDCISLTREQKSAIGLLSVGTFLEYFDLMLYIHMAALLNELFFEPASPLSTSLLTAFAFCSTYVLRPFGALLFGWIGDNIGRRETVIITTLLMAFSCFIVAILPTYAQIGVTASWIITICRVIQGITSMGERIGAELYLTETIKPPIQYPAVTSISVCGSIGTTFALGIASLVTLYGVNWRYAFAFGMVIAVIGSVARTTLRETPDFADAKRRIKKTLEEAQEDVNILNDNPIVQEKISKKTLFSLFLLQCSWPVWLYFSYIHCGNILKNSFDYTTAEVIHQNFIISIIELAASIVLTYLSYRIYPLKILKVMIIIIFTFILLCPYFLYNIHSTFELFLIQSFVVALGPSVTTAMPIFFKHLPVFKRFTAGSLAYAFARMIMSIITVFGMVYLTEYFGHWGLLIVMIPTCAGYAFGLRHFIKLEKQAGCYAHN